MAQWDSILNANAANQPHAAEGHSPIFAAKQARLAWKRRFGRENRDDPGRTGYPFRSQTPVFQGIVVSLRGGRMSRELVGV